MLFNYTNTKLNTALHTSPLHTSEGCIEVRKALAVHSAWLPLAAPPLPHHSQAHLVLAALALPSGL